MFPEFIKGGFQLQGSKSNLFHKIKIPPALPEGLMRYVKQNAPEMGAFLL